LWKNEKSSLWEEFTAGSLPSTSGLLAETPQAD
jgi:hypothetical protein